MSELIDVKDRRMAGLLRKDSVLEKLAGDLKFTEGPVWLPGERALLFSDIPADTIYRWKEGEGLTVFRQPSGNANGHTLDRRGRLVSCEHGTRRVTRTEADGSLSVLAERYEGKRLNSPNDVVVASGGFVYFTDPPYGVKAEEVEQPLNGVYRLNPDLGKLELLAADFDRPNGLVFSPDEKKLYIADSSDRRHVRVFDVLPSGRLAGPGSVFATLDDTGVPDGMRVDSRGRLYVTGGGGIWVYEPSGTYLGRILVPETPANCAFGGPDLSTLYITARTSLYRIRLAVTGQPVGPGR